MSVTNDTSLLLRPRRSLLFMPGSNKRALEKARKLPADVLIFDLEDAVSPEEKVLAREQVLEALKSRAYGHRERVVRINHIASREGLDDLTVLATAGADAILLPKVESEEQIAQAASMAAQLGAPNDFTIWATIETPKGVLNAASIAAHPATKALVAGTNDLCAGLRIHKTAGREALQYALSAIVMAARAYDKPVFDGTYIQLKDMQGLHAECIQGRLLGFDGKTLIHPEQVEITNEVFSPTHEEVSCARAVIAAYERTQAQHQAVTLVAGAMIEALHVRQALDTLKLHESIEKHRILSHKAA